MRLRDALKSREECEREGVCNNDDMGEGQVFVEDGGDMKNLWTYVRDNRIRTIRLEERQIIIVRLLAGTFITVLGGIVVAIAVSIIMLLI